MYSSQCFRETFCFHLHGRIIETAGSFKMLVPISQTIWQSLKIVILISPSALELKHSCVLVFRSCSWTCESWLHMFSQHFTPGIGFMPCYSGLAVHASE
jgi:hypothetical protein